MKTIKQIISVIALVMFMFTSFEGYSQKSSKFEFPPKGNSTILIPSDNKSTTNEIVVCYSEYSKKADGFITISLDRNGDIVEITAPKTVPVDVFSNKAMGPIADCNKECGGGSGNWSCFASCIVDAIIEQL